MNPTCFCNHDHDQNGKCVVKDCDCKRYRPRPCKCSHPFSLHKSGGRCLDKACNCREYSADKTPESLLKRGVRNGEWQYITQDQLRFVMRPDQDPTLRVWACGMLHSIGQRNRMAVKKTAAGKKVALSPTDIVDELHTLDPSSSKPRLDRAGVRRELAELERRGAARRIGRLRNNVKLFFYAKPLSARSIPGELELIEPETEDLVGYPDYQICGSDSKDATCRHDQFLNIRKTFVKGFHRRLREDIGVQHPDLVGQPDYQNLVDEAVEAVMLVVQSAYQKLVQVVCTASQTEPLLKEDSNSSITSSSSEETTTTTTAESPTAQPSTIREVVIASLSAFPHIGAPTDKQYDTIYGLVPAGEEEDLRAFLGVKLPRLRNIAGMISTIRNEFANWQEARRFKHPEPAVRPRSNAPGVFFCESCEKFSVNELPDGSRGECSNAECPSRKKSAGRAA